MPASSDKTQADSAPEESKLTPDQPVAQQDAASMDETGATAEQSAARTDGEGAPEADQAEARVADPVQEALGRFLVHWRTPIGESEEGPLYVLWDLIESYKVDIFDVSLLTITEDFLQFLSSADQLQIELASSFTVMASRLIYYKSKALLPDPGFEDTEEEPRLPPELVQQLLEYRKFQLAADRLREREEMAGGMLTRTDGPIPEHLGQDGEWLEVSLLDLIAAYSNLLRRQEQENQPEDQYEIELEEISVEDKIHYLRGLLEQSTSFSFDELFENLKVMSRGDVIATFLALLELTRQGEIILRQKANFQEIRIFKKSVVVK